MELYKTDVHANYKMPKNAAADYGLHCLHSLILNTDQTFFFFFFESGHPDSFNS